jgi:hypothetical protein
MSDQEQTVEAELNITAMFPAERGLHALYANREGSHWQTPVLAWGTWVVRQTIRDRCGSPKVQSFQQSGPLVYAFEVGMFPASLVPSLLSLRSENYEYRGVQPADGPADALWMPRGAVSEPAAQQEATPE